MTPVRSNDVAVTSQGLGDGDTFQHRRIQLIGLDLGGTKLHYGTLDSAGVIVNDIVEPTRAESEDALFNQLVQAVERLRDDRPELVVALGVPGAVDPLTGAMELSPNIPISPGRRLGGALQAALGGRVVVENDVNLAALAETQLGAAKGLGLVAFLAFGTGVGLGIVANGSLLRGANGRAGEIGYLPFGDDPFAATNAGHFEDLVGSAAIRARYGADLPDVKAIFARAKQGDARALAVIEETAAAAALGLAGLQALLDPDRIVIGGSIGMQRQFFDPLRATAERLLPFPLALAQAELGPASGVLGALALAAEVADLPITGIDHTPLTADRGRFAANGEGAID
ncbi:ROK family protein [Consotaella salsifontis]|uniref:Sugar kinase of the NBD/HSP70 family, may contain an N-terminal HTH domain n=1 Tax=Consotaella salsifontis TaxID=1365950 RepID=A0A1T4RAM1_9HYPH|nr:Sugar kinase of the NBD/HSP70 family, may contain an N-terminal HTH domain [Consotaella salsifontis]